MIHTCLSTLISQREVSHVILAQGGAALLEQDKGTGSLNCP